MVLAGGELVFLILKGAQDELVPICGWVVELVDDEAVVGTALAATSANIPGAVEGKSGAEKLLFVRVPQTSLATSQPAVWKGNLPSTLPSWTVARAVWRQVDVKGLGSSEAEVPRPKPSRAASKKGLQQEMQDLSHLFGDATDSEEDDEEADQDFAAAASSSQRVLAPGAPAKGRKVDDAKKKSKKDGLNVRALLADGISKGQSASEMLPLAVLAMVMKSEKGEKARGKSSALLGGSSSESESDGHDFTKSGMKAVVSLNKLHARIKDRPSKIYNEFEREIVKELGIIPGQAWTLRDYVKKQNWGKFKGIFRCAIMDAAAYEMLRAGEVESATAQLAQNLKAKMQAVMAGGDWEAAWLLTGLADPLSRREFAGSREEMAIVSGYMEALSKLKKKVREAGNQDPGDEDAEEGGKSHRK